MRIRPLSFLLAIPLVASAQQTEKKRQPTTTVTGHVHCADTNAPARLASIMLEPVRVLDSAGHWSSRSEEEEVTMTAVETTLDGSFLIPKVVPGTYYVIAYKQGYLSPLANFPEDVLTHPSDEDRKHIAAAVPKITIEAGLPASIDLRLERGAAISGAILFDDGTPAAGLAVHALVRRKQGQKETWTALPPSPFITTRDAQTDDLGHYRLIGLSPREYIVQVTLELKNTLFGLHPGQVGGSSMPNQLASIAFYSGSTARQHDATPFKLTAGEERSGEDFIIPLAKLHSVTGELVAAHDGHPLNHGYVKLIDADDKSELEHSKIERTDGKFHLYFVPEGNYLLHVSDAADVTYEDIPFPPGTMPPTHEETHILHIYGHADQPINIHDDVPTVVISVPEKSAAPAAKQTPAAQ